MKTPQPMPVVLSLAENDVLGQVRVAGEAYDRFELDGEIRLDELVAAWKHLAAPKASQSRIAGRNGK